MEKHELVDRYGKNTGKILTQIESSKTKNLVVLSLLSFSLYKSITQR